MKWGIFSKIVKQVLVNVNVVKIYGPILFNRPYKMYVC